MGLLLDMAKEVATIMEQEREGFQQSIAGGGGD
jgi:hypothetical protein